jgi:hypothetical protein
MKKIFKLYISSNIVKVMKSMRTFYEARKKSAKYKILVGKPRWRKKRLRKVVCRLENNYKMTPGCGKQYNTLVSAVQEEVYMCAVKLLAQEFTFNSNKSPT